MAQEAARQSETGWGMNGTQGARERGIHGQLTGSQPERRVPFSHPAMSNGNIRDFDPPTHFPRGGSVFDYLLACRPHQGTQPLELRIIRSTFRKAKVPRELEEDAAQAIRLAWVMNRVKTDEFEPEQVLQYAYRIAAQAALHERREIQNIARLPGNGFRKRSDGSRYAPDGVLAPAFSWEDMERFHRTDDGHDEDQAVHHAQNAESELHADQGALVVEHGESALEQSRARFFEEYACRLTTVQYEILQDLASGMALKEIHSRRHISYIRLLKEISISSSILGVDIAKIELRKK